MGWWNVVLHRHTVECGEGTTAAQDWHHLHPAPAVQDTFHTAAAAPAWQEAVSAAAAAIAQGVAAVGEG